jgi:hypothetical protein
VTTTLKVITQKTFQKYFQQSEHRWAKSIAAEGEYFEGSKLKYTGMRLAIK